MKALIFKDGTETEVIREDDRFYYAKESKFRKNSGNYILIVRGDESETDENTPKKENAKKSTRKTKKKEDN